MVDHGFLAFRIASGFAEFRGRIHGGISLIHIDERSVRQAGRKFLPEDADFFRRTTLGPVESDRQAQDKGADAPFRGKSGDPPEGVHLADIDGLDRMGEDTERVGRGDPDARIAVIDAEGRVKIFAVHAQIMTKSAGGGR